MTDSTPTPMPLTNRADRLAVSGDPNGIFQNQIRGAMIVQARYVHDSSSPAAGSLALAEAVLDDSQYFARRFADLAVFDASLASAATDADLDAVSDSTADAIVGAIWAAFVRS